MRYFTLLLIIALLLTGCGAEPATTLPTAEPSSLSDTPTMIPTESPTQAPTEPPTQAPTETTAPPTTEAPKPTLPEDTDTLKQCVTEYLETRFSYLSGEDVQVAYASEALMEELAETRQELTEDGITLIEFTFEFGDIFHESTYADLQVWKTVTYSIDGQEATDMVIYQLHITADDQGNPVIADDKQYGGFSFSFGG